MYYIILNYPNMARFLIFETLCLGWAKTLTYVCKKYHKNEWHLSLVAHTFTQLLHNMCLINTHIFIYWYVRCNCKLWKALWFYCIFSYIIDEYSCLKYCIFTKLSQIVCLINVHILDYQHAKCDCWLWKVLWFDCVFLWIFHIITYHYMF